MKFVKVNEVPSRVQKRDVHAYLKEFMRMNIKTVRVEDHGYKSAKVAANCIGSSVKRHVFPIDVRQSGNDVYLIRRDI